MSETLMQVMLTQIPHVAGINDLTNTPRQHYICS